MNIARHFDLIGGKLLAGDSTKLRAQNSKKNNYNQKKIDQHLAYIDNKLNEYEKELSDGDGDNKEIIEQEIVKQKHRKQEYLKLEKLLWNIGFKEAKNNECSFK